MLATVSAGDAWLEFLRATVESHLCLHDDPQHVADIARQAATFATHIGHEDAQLVVLALQAWAEHALHHHVAATETLDRYLALWTTTGGTIYPCGSLVEAGVVRGP